MCSREKYDNIININMALTENQKSISCLRLHEIWLKSILKVSIWIDWNVVSLVCWLLPEWRGLWEVTDTNHWDKLGLHRTVGSSNFLKTDFCCWDATSPSFHLFSAAWAPPAGALAPLCWPPSERLWSLQSTLPVINNTLLSYSCQLKKRFPVSLTQINSPYLSSGTKAGIGRITVYGKKAGERIIDGVFLMTGPFVSQIRL